MTRPPLIAILLCSSSKGALHFGIEMAASYNGPQSGIDTSEAALGFLGRVRLWLRIIFSGFAAGQPHVEAVGPQRDIEPNRHTTRLRQRALPLARRGDLLAHHIRRRYGHARFLDWIYNRTLTPRFRWCFTAWNWAWRPRMCFVRCDIKPLCPALCSAILTPD